MVTKRKAWKLEHEILKRKHDKLQEDYDKLKSTTLNNDAGLSPAEDTPKPQIKADNTAVSEEVSDDTVNTQNTPKSSTIGEEGGLIQEANLEKADSGEAKPTEIPKASSTQKPEEKAMDEHPDNQPLEIHEEPTEEKANPDDFDFSCSTCKELFNKEGNFNAETKLIKCPDCGLEVADA